MVPPRVISAAAMNCGRVSGVSGALEGWRGELGDEVGRGRYEGGEQWRVTREAGEGAYAKELVVGQVCSHPVVLSGREKRERTREGGSEGKVSEGGHEPFTTTRPAD